MAKGPFVCVDVETPGVGARRIVMPAASRTFYIVSTKSTPARLRCISEDVDLFELHRIGFRDLLLLVRARRKDWRLQMKIGQGLTLVPLLTGFGHEARKLARSMKVLRQWGFGPSTRNLSHAVSSEQGIISPTVTGKTKGIEADRPNTAIILHLYFRNLWSEFEWYLEKIQRPFHLIITTTEKDQSFEQSVFRSFPYAEIAVLENRGRDIGPFVQIAMDGRLDRFDYFCKLHGKRSGDEGPRAVLGEVWRRATIRDLVGSDQQVERILSRFESSPNVGMIGSSRFRLPNDFIQHRDAWGANKPMTLGLASQLGIEPEDFRLDFFAGSMFWTRKAVLQSLRALNLSLSDFPVENGELDGEIHHALERLFGSLPQTVGMFLEGTRIE
jgi:lipopolysaccharide biosynthesis protein